MIRHVVSIALGSCLVSFAQFAGAAEPPSEIHSDSIPNAKQPQLAVSAGGRIYLTYGHDNAIYCMVKADGGQAFSPPNEIAKVGALADRKSVV